MDIHAEPSSLHRFCDFCGIKIQLCQNSCRNARSAGLKLGTWPIKLTHQSGGNYRSAHWREKSQLYLNKWDQVNARRRQK